MFCQNCNAENNDDALVCEGCGAQLNAMQANFQAQAENMNIYKAAYQDGTLKVYSSTKPIFAAILSIINFNIFGLIFAILSLKNYNRRCHAELIGNFSESQKYGKKSAKFSTVSLVFSLVLLVVRPIFFVVLLMVGASTTGFLSAADTAMMIASLM